MKINGISIEFKKSFAIEEDVDLVINSASGLLFMRTGTAKIIREYSEKLSIEDEKEYFKILKSLSNPVMLKYIEEFGVNEREPRHAQLSSFHKILDNKGPYSAGSIILDKEWSLEEKKDLLHVVGMTYHIDEDGCLDVGTVTEESLKEVLIKGFGYADNKGYETISIPVLCTRGSYGLKPMQTVKVLLEALNEFKNLNIKKIIICFESEGPRADFDQIVKLLK